jgi:prepilin-type N-terminal cleavage/methylation domain-containing protein
MRNRQSGFTLLEILIAIVILGIIMAMNSTLLENMIRSTRQQGSIVTSQFESALGLEIFRNDLGNAGYGLPDAFPVTVAYNEPASLPAQLFNDGSPAVPRAIAHSNSVGATGYLANSDYLVIRSPAVGMNNASGKWTYIMNDAAPVHVWSDSSLDMENGNFMIVIRPRTTAGDTAQLIVDTGGSPPTPPYAIQYNGSAMSNAGFIPASGERFIAYGVDSNSAPTMPFNRADYYVRRITTGANTTSAGCAPGTGTLVKAVANQSNTGFTEYPVMDCVTNMQVVFRIDTNADGTPDSTVNTLAGFSPMLIKEQVKEIRVSVLAHEGTFDRGYQHSGNGTITVGPDSTLGYNVVLPTLVGANWNRYRWKTYAFAVKPRSFY